jgi:hypothetical protein
MVEETWVYTPMPITTVTVRQVAEAMVADETPKITMDFFDGDGASCAVGGAANVLGVYPFSLLRELNDIPKDGVPDYKGDERYQWLGDVITRWNDSTDTPKNEIGRIILDNADEETLNTELHVTLSRLLNEGTVNE